MSMSAAQARRQAVAQALEEAVGPVSAAALAERFSVCLLYTSDAADEL